MFVPVGTIPKRIQTHKQLNIQNKHPKELEQYLVVFVYFFKQNVQLSEPNFPHFFHIPEKKVVTLLQYTIRLMVD